MAVYRRDYTLLRSRVSDGVLVAACFLQKTMEFVDGSTQIVRWNWRIQWWCIWLIFFFFFFFGRLRFLTRKLHMNIDRNLKNCRIKPTWFEKWKIFGNEIISFSFVFFLFCFSLFLKSFVHVLSVKVLVPFFWNFSLDKSHVAPFRSAFSSLPMFTCDLYRTLFQNVISFHFPLSSRLILVCVVSRRGRLWHSFPGNRP